MNENDFETVKQLVTECVHDAVKMHDDRQKEKAAEKKSKLDAMIEAKIKKYTKE